MPERLCIHTHEFHPRAGGIGRYCHEFARAATQTGLEVSVFAPREARRPADDEPGAADRFRLRNGGHGRSHRPLNLWLSRNGMARLMRECGDAAHLLAEPGAVLASALLPKYAGGTGPTLVTLHGSEIERWAAWPTGSGHLAKRALRRADIVLVPSDHVRERCLEVFPEVGPKLRKVAHALPETFRHAASQPDTVCPGSSCPTGLHLLGVGRIHPRKGFDQVLKALALLSASEKRAIRYTIAGARSNERYRRHLRSLAHASGCTVEWVLDPDDARMAELYRRARLFVLTSRAHTRSVEGFGLVYLEAAAFGLPALAYRTGGVADAVRHGATGVTVPTGDPRALAEAIRFFLRDRETARKMGELARSTALARTWRDVVRESLGTYCTPWGYSPCQR